MIIPMVCFSCGKPISHMWFDYLNSVKKYEIEQATTGVTSQTPEFLALRDLHISRICCRRMFLSQQDMYQQIR